MKPLIYDIGLHKGEDSEFYLKKGFRVVGVDADPDLCETARLRLSRFVSSGQLKIVNVAISDRRGTMAFFKSEKSDWGTLLTDWDEQNRRRGFRSEPIMVPSVPLADLIEEHGAPYFIKIDIEGMDLAALGSLGRSTFLPKYISVEMTYPRDPSFASARSEFAALSALGFDRFKIVAQHEVQKQVPPCPAGEGDYADHRFEFGSSGLFGEESPGQWGSDKEALAAFRRIMLRHFPEAQLYRKEGLHKAYMKLRRRLTGRQEYPYWYDIHAKHSGATGT